MTAPATGTSLPPPAPLSCGATLGVFTTAWLLGLNANEAGGVARHAREGVLYSSDTRFPAMSGWSTICSVNWEEARHRALTAATRWPPSPAARGRAGTRMR